MEEKKKEESEVLEETKELKQDISDLQKDIEEIQENVKDVKKKGSFQSVLLTLVVLILFVAFALYGFATGVGYGVKKTKENKKTTTETSDYYSFNNVDIEDVVNLYNNIQPMWHCDSPFFTDKKYSVNDIPNDMAYTIGFKNLSYDTMKEFTAEELDIQIDALLGKEYKFTHKTYETCPSYKYSNKKYKLIGDGCGGTCGPGNVEKIIGASKNGNELDVYVAVLFHKDVDDKIEYYKDFKLTKKVTNYKVDSNMSDVEAAEESIENAKLGTTYKMVFNLEDDNYVFVSAEPIK